MVQTVIFDLDGTLLNTIDDLAAAGNWVCRQNDWPEFTAEEYKTMVGHGIPALVSAFSPENCRGPLRTADSLARFSDYYGKHSLDKTRPYAGIPQLLDTLKRRGMTLAVYSNKADEFSQVIVGHFFPDAFAMVRGKLPAFPVKPDPAGVLSLMGELGADVRNTVFVGDSDVDMHTARNAGLHSCGVAWGFRSREALTAAGAERIFGTPAELERFLLSEA
ncbi:MAG: HAD family hydrolase [Oscillibacter sp.]|jgi:phosphoglycolate phosphatase|nr:HAD family hydrolase [Oscillibacter sp.]